MKTAVSRWMRTARARLPEPRLLLVPGHFFYTHRFEVAEGMAGSEIADFLSLALEGSSPFPLDQLVWGHAHAPGETHALVYATTLARIRSLGNLDLNEFRQVFPGFISLFGEHPRRPTVRFVCQNGAVSALFFSGGTASIPEKILSRPVDADILTDDAIEETRDQLAAAVETPGYTLEPGVWIGDGYSFDQKDQPIFRHRRVGADSNDPSGSPRGHPLAVGDQALWALDLREEGFARQRHRERVLGRRLWTGMRVAAAIAVVLIFLMIAGWSLSRAHAWMDRQLVARQPAADQVLNGRDLINRLANGSAQSTDPIRMLTVVNEVRPDSIFFRTASAENFTVLTVEGESREGANAVNNFERDLRELDPVETVTHAPTIRDGRTYFVMTVTFDAAVLAASREEFATASAP